MYSIYSLSSFFDKCRNKTLTRIFVTEIFQRKNKFLGNFEIGFIGCRTPLLSCPDKMFIGIYKRDYTVTIYFWFFNLRNEWMVAGYIWSFSTAIENIKHWHKVYIFFNKKKTSVIYILEVFLLLKYFRWLSLLWFFQEIDSDIHIL